MLGRNEAAGHEAEVQRGGSVHARELEATGVSLDLDGVPQFLDATGAVRINHDETGLSAELTGPVSDSQMQLLTANLARQPRVFIDITRWDHDAWAAKNVASFSKEFPSGKDIRDFLVQHASETPSFSRKMSQATRDDLKRQQASRREITKNNPPRKGGPWLGELGEAPAPTPYVPAKAPPRGMEWMRDRTGEQPNIEPLRTLEHEARVLRGKLTFSISKDRLEDRARIELAIRDYRDEVRHRIGNMIYKYAAKIGLRGEPYNRVDTLIKNTHTAAGFERALAIMDRVSSDRASRALVDKVNTVVDAARQELTDIAAQKKPSPRPIAYNETLQHYIDGLSMDPKRADAVVAKAEAQLDAGINGEKDAASNADGGMSSEALEAIVAMSKQNVAEMSNDQLVRVLADIENIKRDGRTAWFDRQVKRKAEREQKARAAAAEVMRAGNVKLPQTKAHLALQPKPSGWDKIVRGIKGIEKSNLDPKRMFQWMAGTYSEAGRRDRSILETEIHERLRTAYYNETDAYRSTAETIRKIFEPVLKQPDALTKKYTVTGDFYTFNHDFSEEEKQEWDWLNDMWPSERSTQEQQRFDELKSYMKDGRAEASSVDLSLEGLMFVYANSLNPGNRAHLYGTGWTDETIDKAEALLPSAAREAVDKLIKFYDEEQYFRLNNVFRSMFDIDMPRVEHYFPISNIASSKAETAIAADQIQRYSARAGVNRGFTKMRMESKAPFRRMSFFHTVFDNAQKVEHFIAMAQELRDAQQFVRQRDLALALQQRDEHFDTPGWVDDFLKRMAYGKTKNTESGLDKFADFVRFNYTTYLLGFNPRTWLKTVGNIPVAMKYVAPSQISRSAYDLITDYKDLRAMALEKSPLMRMRENGYEREVQELREKFADKEMFGFAKGHAEDIRRFSMAGISTLDRINSTIVWVAAYRQQLAKTADEATAVRLADEAVENAIPGGGLISYSNAQVAPGALNRSFTMFTSDMVKIFNAAYETMHQIPKDGWEHLPEKAWEIALLSIIPATWMYLVDHGLDPRRLKDDPEGVISYALSQLWGGMGAVGQLLDVAFAKTIADPIRRLRGAPPPAWGSTNTSVQIPWASAFSDLLRPVDDIMKAHYALAGMHTLDYIGAATGMPLKFPMRVATGAADLISGKTHDPRALMWSPTAMRDVSVEGRIARDLVTSDPKKRLRAAHDYAKASPEAKKVISEKLKENARKSAEAAVRKARQ
jgi:hypothetical protein